MSLFDTSGLEFTVSGSDATIIGIGTYDLPGNSGTLNIPATVDTSPTSGPYNVVAIGDSAFANNSSVQRALLDGATFLTNIGLLALFGCTNMTSVTIPNSVTSFGYATFGGSGNITDGLTVTFAPTSSLQALAQGAFVNSFLRSIDIPSSVQTIELDVFRGCQSLTNVTIPSSVLSLGASAFQSSTSLTTITIPNSVTSIGNSAFANSYITSITVPSSVTYIGDGAFSYCYSLLSIDITSASITSINSLTFVNVIATQITIPSGVTSIGTQAFQDSSLTELSLPGSVATIGDQAYYNTDLTSISIPATVASIGSQAFSGTPATSITVYGTVPISVNYGMFRNILPCPPKIAFPEAIVPPAEVVAHSGSAITGIGLYYPPDHSNILIIPSTLDGDTITSVANSAFIDGGCFTQIQFPVTMTQIGNSGFRNCPQLTSVTIPSSITQVDAYAFYNCSNLTNLTLDNGVSSLGDDGFEYCPITQITIPSSLTSIGTRCFYSARFTSLSIPSTVTQIGAYTFWDNSLLQAVVFGGGYSAGYESDLFRGGTPQPIPTFTTTNLASWPSPTYFTNQTLTQAGGGGGGDPYVSTISNIRYKLPALNAPIRFYQGAVDGKLLTINAQLRTTPNADMTAENLRSYFEYKHKVPAHKRKELEYAVYAKEDLCFYEKFYISYNDSELVVNVWEPKFKFESYKGKVVSETSTRGDLIARCTGAYDHYETNTLKFTFGSANLYISVYPNRLVRSSIYLEAPAMSKGNGVIVNTLSVRHMSLGALNSQESVPKKDSAMKEKEEWFLDHVDYRTRKFYMAR